MNNTLFKAILSIDSYNRGYNESAYLPSIINSTKVGDVTIVAQSDITQDSLEKNAGFYAAAYKKGNDIIISYRGTDALFGGNGFGSDLWNGYGVAATSPHGKQAELAIKFYQSVAAEYPDATISFTGHSLGAGLAGLVAGIYKKPAMLYDNMPFEGAATNAYKIATKTNAQILSELGPNHTPIEYSNAIASRDALKNLIYGTSEPTPGYSFPTSSIRAFHTEGEFLQAFRVGQKTISAVMEHGDNVDLPGLLDSGIAGGGWHSMSTLVMLTYVHGSGLPNQWMESAKYFWPVLYNPAFAQKIGVTPESVPGTDSNEGKYDSALRQIIAYSALDSGERPFGDTAIRAMFDDANDLGEALGANISLTGYSLSGELNI